MTAAITIERCDAAKLRAPAPTGLLLTNPPYGERLARGDATGALDAALRKDLGKYSAAISDLRLADYKVRILTSGTEAVTRVMVESADGKGNRWSTVGVSENIVDASFEALTDSIIYKLYKDSAPV